MNVGVVASTEISVKRCTINAIDVDKKIIEFIFSFGGDKILEWKRVLILRGRLQTGISLTSFTRLRISPRSRCRCRSSTGLLDVMGEDMCGIMFNENENLSTDDLSKSLISIEKRKYVLMDYTRHSSMIIGILLETSHCLNPEKRLQGSKSSIQLHQKDLCGFSPDCPGNRWVQDLQTCSGWMVKHVEKLSVKVMKEKSKFHAARRFPQFRTMIVIRRMSWIITEDNCRQQESQRYLAMSLQNWMVFKLKGSDWILHVQIKIIRT